MNPVATHPRQRPSRHAPPLSSSPAGNRSKPVRRSTAPRRRCAGLGRPLWVVAFALTFHAGDTIFITARLRGLGGQPVTVAWFGPGDLSAGTETAAVKPDGTIYFTKADTSSWIPGDYRVTLSAGPRTLISEQFHILGSEAAVMPHQ